MMRFIRPVAITDAMLISSTAPENDYAAWSGATTYALGQRVIKTAPHRIYESAQAGNLNHDPATDTAGTWWIDVAPTNRWAMFDQAVGSQTSQATPLTVVIEPGAVQALALLDVEASTVTVTMTDGAAGPTVYSASVDMIDGAALADWYAYFFDAIEPRDSLVLEDLPLYASGRITVAIAAATTARCGTLAVGIPVELGEVRAGARVGIIDYSRKEVDVYGVTQVVERSYAKRIDADLVIDAARLDYVARQLAAIRATPVVWIADDSTSSLIVYGWVRDWGIDLVFPTIAEGRLTVEGLT